MFSHCRRYVLGVVLCSLLVLGACAVAPAPKVQCDAKLRPINTGDPDRTTGSAPPERREP